MKHNSLALLLVGVLGLSVLATAALSFTYVQSRRNLSNLQVQANVISQNRATLHRLVAEAVEYSKSNPAIEPILESVGISIKLDSTAPAPLPNTPANTKSTPK